MVRMNISLLTTLENVKEFIKEFKSEGCECPACGQKVKTYTRKLNSGMVSFLRGLDSMTKALPGTFFTLSEILKYIKSGSKSLDYSVLKYWDFIRSDKPGRWYITERGQAFIAGKIAVSRSVIIYNNKLEYFSRELVKYDIAKNDVFNLKELMDG